MGCTDSTEVVENKNKQRPAFNMIENASFVEGEDMYLMGELEEDLYISATITTSRIPATLLNPNAKSPITLKQLPKIVSKPMTLEELKQHEKKLPSYKPYNFNQIIRVPEQSNPYIKKQQCWYFISGGVNYKLSDITSDCFLFNSKYNSIQVMPKLNQPRYTHCSLIHNGWVYVLGGREFGEDDSAIMNHCQKLNIKNLTPLMCLPPGKPAKNAGQWIQIAPMNKSRCTFFAVVHQNKIWAVGGYTGQFQRSTLLQYYQPQKQNKWHQIQVSLPFGIESAVPLVTNKNQITIFGGNSDSGPMNTVLTLNFFEKNIKAAHKLKQNRLLHKSSYNAKQNCIYLFGGNEKMSVQMYKLNENGEVEEEETEVSTLLDIGLSKYFKTQEQFESLGHSQPTYFIAYSPISSIPTQYSPSQNDEIVYILGTSYEPFILELNISVPYTLYHPIPLQIEMHALQGGIYLKKNMFMILGGITDTMDKVSSKVFIYDAKNKKGRQIQSMCESRYAFAYEKIGEYIYVAGGGTSDLEGELIILSKAERLNISEDVYEAKWSSIADLPEGLISPMSLNYAQSLYVFGGMKRNNERNQCIYRYNSEANFWKQLQFKLPFGLQASSVIKNTESQFLIFGGRLVNGDSKGIWSLSLIESGQNCVFSEKGEMTEAKCLHKTYRPQKQNFFVVFGGQNELLSYYDCNSFEAIDSDILLGMKMIFLKSLQRLGQKSLKNYLIVSKQ